MPHCQKEFSKPPVSSKNKKAQQAAKKEQEKAKAAKKALEEKEEELARAREQDPAEREAELARQQEVQRKEAEARRLKEAKKKAGEAFQREDWDEALARYSECIELEPEDHIHWSNRAAVYKNLRDFEKSLADATKCTEISPEWAKGWARVGIANFVLDRLEAAEEAFRQGLTINEDNAWCLDGLRDIEKARECPPPNEEPTEGTEESPEERAYSALLKELQAMELHELKSRALEQGVEEVKVDEAQGSENPKEALINLITAHSYLVNLIVGELQGLTLLQLRARASQEGVAEEKIAEAAELDDPTASLTALIVRHLSNDLVEAAAELQAEVVEEYADDSDDDEADDNDIDFEVVTIDEADEGVLSTGDIFVAGAYIDDQYGELVLPNGTRLGNRALSVFYRQRARPVKDRQLVPMLSNLKASIVRRENRKMMLRDAGKTAKSVSQHSIHKYVAPDNKAMRAIVHHWGAGGGGSHYWGAGGKQYNKGNKVKGVILRHSTQGAKLQAARNKSNRGNKSVACLQ
mmetsp:Transcript_80504/g.223987  ORF Transcript_80504/g.223987 Transcript_80504/m.223987 type:complete len:522 (+) Transcript_80504:98-1663(+)